MIRTVVVERFRDELGDPADAASSYALFGLCVQMPRPTAIEVLLQDRLGPCAQVL